MVESAGNGSASAKHPWISEITSLLDDFFTGNTHDGNLDALLRNYENDGCHPRNSFWEASGLQAEGPSVSQFWRQPGSFSDSRESGPELGSYKLMSLD